MSGISATNSRETMKPKWSFETKTTFIKRHVYWYYPLQYMHIVLCIYHGALCFLMVNDVVYYFLFTHRVVQLQYIIHITLNYHIYNWRERERDRKREESIRQPQTISSVVFYISWSVLILRRSHSYSRSVLSLTILHHPTDNKWRKKEYDTLLWADEVKHIKDAREAEHSNNVSEQRVTTVVIVSPLWF